MNIDYSKVFELLNQDAEKERNKKAKKEVHDNLYNKGFRDGLAVLDKIRAEIDKARFIDKDTRICKNALASGLEVAMQIIDKYKAEGRGEDKE